MNSAVAVEMLLLRQKRAPFRTNVQTTPQRSNERREFVHALLLGPTLHSGIEAGTHDASAFVRTVQIPYPVSHGR